MTIGDEFEQMIAHKLINFHPAKPNDLDTFGRSIVTTFLSGLHWELGDVKIGNSYCLKLSDEFLHYLDILPDTQQFMWCTINHHDSIHPDVASAYLLTQQLPGATATCTIDDQSGTRTILIRQPNGQGIRILDQEIEGVRIFSFEHF